MKKSVRFAKSGLIGIVASLTDMGILTLLVQFAGLPPHLAVIPSAISGSTIQFLGQRKFAFESKSEKVGTEAKWFIAGEMGSWLISAGILFLFTKFTSIHYTIARILTGAIVFAVYSYPIWRLIFKPKEKLQTVHAV